MDEDLNKNDMDNANASVRPRSSDLELNVDAKKVGDTEKRTHRSRIGTLMYLEWKTCLDLCSMTSLLVSHLKDSTRRQPTDV